MTKTTRRRGAALETAIVTAAWEELHETGYADATVDGVAERAGTSKTVLYRRWRNRPELFLAALGHFAAAIAVPDTGDPRGDLVALLEQVRGVLDALPRDLLSGLITDTRHDPQLFEQVRDHVANAGVNDHVRVILNRAASRGQLPADSPPARVCSLPIDLLRNEFLMSRESVPHEAVVAIVDDVVMPLLRRPAP